MQKNMFKGFFKEGNEDIFMFESAITCGKNDDESNDA